MHNPIRVLFDRTPLHFRALYRQFLLRVIDLEALSIEADIPRFLGQFAGVLIFFSLAHAFLGYVYVSTPESGSAGLPSFAWHMVHHLIATMMLVVGLVAVVSWDSIFPDRRDAMILGPLPVKPSMILISKVAATSAVVGLGILTLNFASGLVWPLALSIRGRGPSAFFQEFAAYWFTMIAAVAFVYGSVLTVQGLSALPLPRRLFLALSAILQLVAFGLFFGVYFLEPSLTTPAALSAPENQNLLAWAPSYWFFALFNQLCGTLPNGFGWLALRGWIGLAVAVFGSSSSLLLCYLRTMRRTIEQPDLLPAARGFRWMPRLGSSIETAILLFSFRSLTRSRHHRLAFAFYMAIVLAVALSFVRNVVSNSPEHAVNTDFIMTTLVMMSFAVVGLRNVSSLPISLTANWMLRTSQLFPPERYIAASRHMLLVLTVLPVWMFAAALSFHFRPWHQAAGHLAILAILGSLLVDLSLIGFYKIPFTCSYLPGKVNFQFVFWGSLLVLLPLAVAGSRYELAALHDPFRLGVMILSLGSAALCLWAFNRHRARSAELYFEELPPEVITTLGLISAPPPVTSGE
jgi:hypothetical protein